MKNTIVVCSTNTGSKDLTLSDVDTLCKDRGYKLSPEGYCRYHYVIRRNGDVQMGRSEELVGWHHDKYDCNALLIALVGSPDNCTRQQFYSLSELLEFLDDEFPGRPVVDASKANINETGVNNDFI